ARVPRRCGVMSRSLDGAATEALAVDGIESVAIFLTRTDGPDGELTLAGAAGGAGPPPGGRGAGVADPPPPIPRAAPPPGPPSDPGPPFDVTPMNPGGPRLRSHLPIRTLDGRTLGVLAVAHDAPVGEAARNDLTRLATAIASTEEMR